MEYYDTYYTDGSQALKNALQNNRVLAPNKTVSALQICFYNGKKIENAPENCIHVPFDTIVAYFSSTKYRIPKVIETTDTFLEKQFYEKLTEIENILNQKKKNLYREIQNLQPNFQDKRLRIFAYGCRETVLIKYFMENIIEAARNLGYEAYLHTQTNELEACSEVSYLEALRDFNPKVTININHFNNHFLNKSIFNFVWFQDAMPVLTNDKKVFVRKHDYVFYITQGLGCVLLEKNILSRYQPFVINTNTYKVYPDIKKEKKIVFIGASHKRRLDIVKKYQNFEIVYKELIKLFEKNSYIDIENNSEIKQLVEKYFVSHNDIHLIWSYFERDYAVEKLCAIDTEYQIEIYGSGWEENPIIAPYFKGILEYGEDISKIYNSATYGYCPGGYILMQRTLECACSGTTPLVLDVRKRKVDQYNKIIEDSMEFFHLDMLEDILKKTPEARNFDFIREEYGYMSLVKRFMDVMYQETQHYDTYYLNSSEALKNALQNNRVLAPNKKVSALQICFYNGERIENTPQNCIHVPFENFVAYFSDTNYRIPQVIATTASFFKEEFAKKLTAVELIVNQKKEKLYQEIKNLKPNFKDKKLRIFAFGCRETFLTKHFMQDIIQAATTLGYETYLHTQTSELQSCNQVHYLEAFKNFNPHITININEFNNHFLNDAVFNFVWFQDSMPILMTDEKRLFRKKDYVFDSTQGLEYFFKKRDIKAKYQPFCIDTAVYKIYPQIQKEKKIVFIGSSYKERLELIKEHKNFKIIYEELVKIFKKASYIEIEKNIDMKQLEEKYFISYDEIYLIWSYLERDYIVEILCSLDTEYKIEIYGHGWEKNPIVSPYFKGVLEYGEAMSKIYNSATYGYCSGDNSLTQRILECVCSGTIPLVLDIQERKVQQYNKIIEDFIEFFNLDSFEDVLKLQDMLKKEPQAKNFDFPKEEYGYTHMVKNFLDIVYQNIRN